MFGMCGTKDSHSMTVLITDMWFHSPGVLSVLGFFMFVVGVVGNAESKFQATVFQPIHNWFTLLGFKQRGTVVSASDSSTVTCACCNCLGKAIYLHFLSPPVCKTGTRP